MTSEKLNLRKINFHNLVIYFLLIIIILQFVFYLSKDESNNCKEQFKYLTPITDCNEFDDRSQKMSSLEGEISSYINNKTEDGDRLGVWVRDLNSKRFAGVNSQTQFYLASLLKVPLLVSYLKMAEVDPSILERNINYQGIHNDDTTQLIIPSDKLVKGQSYTVKELLFHAIVYSDNNAALELTSLLPNGYLERTLNYLGVQIERPSGSGEVIITPRSYANILRTLYNSSYLSPYYSNEALSLLMKTSYKDGVVAGFPKDIEVAHKFGERFYEGQEGDIMYQLHDCGIAYFEKGENPVLFCVMTEGKSIEKLQSYLQDIAHLITDNLSD